MKKLLFIIVVAALSGCVNHHHEPQRRPTGMANPAAVYCHERGGRSVNIETQQGVRTDCVFPDGRHIDEWELYRHDHR